MLVVSHGGLIQQLILHFIDRLGCRIPGGRTAIARSPHNTAVSKFTVSLHEDDLPHLTCLLVYDRDHLLTEQFSLGGVLNPGKPLTPLYIPERHQHRLEQGSQLSDQMTREREQLLSYKKSCLSAELQLHKKELLSN